MVAAWVVSRLTAPASGEMEDLYKRVRIGMTLEEAVSALQAGEHDYVECIYTWATDSQGKRFFTGFSFLETPPPSEVQEIELEVTCCTGESVKVTLGKGGIVREKEYRTDPHEPHQYWLHLLHLAFGH
jgi:hypothetical protein